MLVQRMGLRPLGFQCFLGLVGTFLIHMSVLRGKEIPAALRCSSAARSICPLAAYSSAWAANI
jgi:hypothetical protein